jgi:membrane-bound hydrogenase subunit mbhJ
MLKSLFKWGLKRSPAVYHVGASACNNCDLEIVETLTPRFDMERYGVTLAPSPRHADVMLVAGIVNRLSAERVKRVYDQMPGPKFVVAVGVCACSGDLFRDSYNFYKPVDELIPVDVYVPGCPPKPEAIVSGILKALKKIK